MSGEPFLRVPGLVPLTLIVGLMVLQLVPLPVWILKIVSPQSWFAYKNVYELAGGSGWLPISVNQKATLQELLRYCAYTFFYLLTVQLLRDGPKVRKTLFTVVTFGTIIAFFCDTSTVQ